MKIPTKLTLISTALVTLLTLASNLSNHLNPVQNPGIARGLIMLPLVGIIMLCVHFYLSGIDALIEATADKKSLKISSFFAGLILTMGTGLVLIIVGFGIIPKLGALTPALLTLFK